MKAHHGLAAANDDSDDLGGDLLEGAAAIAEFMNWPEGKKGERRVYHCAEKGALPIHKVEGFGICARKSALRSFFAALDAPFLTRVDEQPEQS